MANTLITPSIIAKEALFQLENNVIMGQNVHRQYKNEFVKIGNTVTIRKPVKFVAKDGATRSNQDVIEETTSIVIDQRKHVSWSFSTQDLTLTIEEYSERYIKPAMIVLANEIDKSLCLEGAQEFHNLVGTPGTTPADFTALANVGQRMDEIPVPDDGQRCLVVNPAARWGLADGLGGAGSGGVFNADIVGPMVRKGALGELANLMIYGDQNIQTHTVGTYTGTPLVNDASFTNDTNVIAFDGMTGSQVGAVKKGDIITIAGVNAVNEVSKADLGYLKQFVVTADADTTAGAGSLTVYPDLNDGSTASTEAYQTVSALPADNAAITIVGTAATAYPQNLAFHKNALALVTVPLELPDSATFKARADWRGFSIRVIKDYDIDNDEEIIRLDILFGKKAIYPELGVRLTG
jgi:hypothetical protein